MSRVSYNDDAYYPCTGIPPGQNDLLVPRLGGYSAHIVGWEGTKEVARNKIADAQ
jgi:hypothetical protein